MCLIHTEGDEAIYTVAGSLREEGFHYEFMEQELVIVKNPMVWIGFCLTREDVVELLEAVMESIGIA